MFNPWPNALSFAVALATLASPVLVQAQSLSFNLPAGPLARTLNAIASQSGQIISLDPVLVRDKLAPAVIGQMPTEQALHMALAGSSSIRTYSEGEEPDRCVVVAPGGED